MSTSAPLLSDLLDVLDAAPHGGRLALYARTNARFTTEDLRGADDDARPCAGWLALRTDAGPVGQSLPEIDEASARLEKGAGTLADAAALWLTPNALPSDEGSLLGHLGRYLDLAMRYRATASLRVLLREFSLLNARAGVAAFALQRQETLNRLAPDDQAFVRAFLGPLEEDEVLRDTPWVRVAAATAWSSMSLPAAHACEPRIGALLRAAQETDPAPVLKRLLAIDHPLGPALGEYLLKLVDFNVREELAEDPTVLAIMRAAHVDARRCEPTHTLPAKLLAWSRAMFRAGEVKAARLGAWLLHDAGQLTSAEMVPFLVLAARRTDLDLLAEHAPSAELRELASDFAESLRDLPNDLADALVAICLRYQSPRVMEICFRHREALAQALPSMRPHMNAEVASLLRTLQSIADERVTAEPTWARIVARAQRISAEPSSPAELETSIAAEAPELLPLAVLELSAERIDGLAPRDALRVALLLLAWLPGNPHAELYQRGFAEKALHAILAAEDVAMLPRAAALVDGLLKRGGVTHNVAELLYYRARVAPPATLQRPDERAQKIRDLRLAVTIARRQGAGWCEVKASCQLVTVLLLDLPMGPARVRTLAEAKGILDSAESAATAWEMLPELWSKRAHLLLLDGDPDAAAEAWRRALAHTEVDRHLSFRADLLSNLAQVLTFSRRPGHLDEAESAAREALRTLPPESGPGSAAFTRGVLGLVLSQHREEGLSESIVLLEDALRVPWPQYGLVNSSTLRLALVHAYQRASQLAQARHHLEVVVADPEVLGDVSLALDALGRAAELDAIDGRNSARALVTELRQRQGDSPWRPTLELVQALIEGLPALVPLASVYIAGDLPPHPLVDGLLHQTIDRHVESLPPQLLEQYLKSGRIDPAHLHLRGKIFLALGRRDELRVEFEQRLTGPQTAPERATTLAFLLEVLPPADPRRSGAIDELDKLLRSTEQRPLQAHLASVLFGSYEENPSYLRLAAEHAEMAVCASLEPMDDLWRLRAGIRGAQMTAMFAESSPRAVEIARWFTQEIALPRSEVDAMRLAIVRQLLFPAALTHPAALELARAFVARIPGLEGEDLERRLAWIERQRDVPDGTRPVVTGLTPGTTTHFDDAPAWLVDLVAGRSTARGPAKVTPADAEWLTTVAPIRPDRAGDLLSWLVEHAAELLPELIHDIVAVPVQTGRDSVAPRLCELLASLVEQRATFPLQKLYVLILQNTRDFGDGTPYERAADALLAAAQTPEERVESHFYKGIERLDAAQCGSTAAPAQIEASREHLDAAAALAAEHPVPAHLHFGILVSSGNAYRRGDARDLERALELYSKAEELGPPNEHEVARLCKVRADALIARARPEDVLQALVLLDRSLQTRRSGWLRAETLISAHEAELAREDLPRLDRLRRALGRLTEAAEHDDGPLAAPLIQLQLRVLDELLAVVPADREAHRRLDALASNDPSISALVQLIRLRHKLPAGVSFDHPIILDFMKNTWGIVPNAAHKLAEKMDVAPLVWARKRLQRLTLAGISSDQPGQLAARAHLCAYLCREAEVELAVAMEAVELALHAVDAVPETWVRAFLLGELSRVFAPEDHLYHPIRDFKRAAELCERALSFDGLPEMTRVDLLGYLARATRYRTDGDVRRHLLRAEEIYEQVVSMHRRAGDLQEAKHTAGNLAELRAALERGGTDASRRTEIVALREAIATAGSGGLLIDRAALARELTLLGSDTPGDEGTALLTEGAERFAALPWARMDPSLFDSADNYHTMCLAELAVRRGDVGGAVSYWRTRLAKFDRGSKPDAWAMAAHNLAELLLRVGGPTEVREALDLCVHALPIRSPEKSLEHHWETTLQLSRTALALLDRRQANRQVFEVALEAVSGALAAATALGGGQRRFRAGVELLRLSLHASGTARLQALAEQAWIHINAGRATLISHTGSAETESHAALAVAENLADRLGEQGLVGVADGCAYVLSGEAASRVLPWVVRAAGAAQRRLAARIHRPEKVPHETWTAWLTALRGGDAGELARVLERIQSFAPDFLTGEPDLQGLTAWLKARPDAAAIVVVEGRSGLIAAALWWRDGLRTSIARLTAPPPPHDEAALARSLAVTEYSELYKYVGQWAASHVIAPLTRIVPDTLKHLLWLPAGPLRMISPAHLWPDVAVSMAADVCLRRWPPPLQSRVAVIVADPGSRGAEIPESLRLTERMATAAMAIGPTRVRLSCGERWGWRLDRPISGLVDGPADASGLICEISEAEVVLLMCHGFADGPDDAELQLITAEGRPDSLTIQQIGADPRRVAGQTIILLSCETGRTGAWIHQAGGMAGALLACGARQVLAPLWPVLVDVAADVGAEALSALAKGRDLAEAIAVQPGDVPVEPEVEISRAGFVLWIA